MTPADRLADAMPEPDPVLSAEEIETLMDLGPSDADLAHIAADEARERGRGVTHRFRL